MENKKYPLDWPVGYPRTVSPERSRFKNLTIYSETKRIMDEVNRLVNGYVSISKPAIVISSNVPLNNDGSISARYQKSGLKDPGMAVYFTKGKQELVLCCDQYDTVESNAHAIYLTIEALRGIDRWGVSDFIERAFTGFKALPQNKGPRPLWENEILKRPWWEVFGFDHVPTPRPDIADILNGWYRTLSKTKHPDKGGSQAAFAELYEAYKAAKRYYQI